VSGSHSRSTGVGLGGSVHRAPSGKVRWSLDWVSYHMRPREAPDGWCPKI
jgi:hypothetical protein